MFSKAWQNGVRKITAIIRDGVELTIDSPLTKIVSLGSNISNKCSLFINVHPLDRISESVHIEFYQNILVHKFVKFVSQNRRISL